MIVVTGQDNLLFGEYNLMISGYEHFRLEHVF